MERRRLLAEKVLDTSQDEVYCLAGFTYSQQIAEKAIAAKGKKTFEEMVPTQYRCHDPSHGGSYMAEGAFFIRIGLPPRVVPGDFLDLSLYRLI